MLVPTEGQAEIIVYNMPEPELPQLDLFANVEVERAMLWCVNLGFDFRLLFSEELEVDSWRDLRNKYIVRRSFATGFFALGLSDRPR